MLVPPSPVRKFGLHSQKANVLQLWTIVGQVLTIIQTRWSPYWETRHGNEPCGVWASPNSQKNYNYATDRLVLLLMFYLFHEQLSVVEPVVCPEMGTWTPLQQGCGVILHFHSLLVSTNCRINTDTNCPLHEVAGFWVFLKPLWLSNTFLKLQLLLKIFIISKPMNREIMLSYCHSQN